MSDIVGQIALELGIDAESLTEQLTGAADSAAKEADKSLTSAFTGIGKKIGGILAGLALGSFTKECLDLGSDLAEVQNVVDTAFKTMSADINAFATASMKEFGLSETIAKQYMGTIGAMNNAFGFTEAESVKMAEAVTGLVGDVASFYNLDPSESFTKLKSIWTGETETLKDLGVVMTQTALDQYALNNGFGKTTANMTEQEKVLLRYQFVTESLSDAVGDFAKTQDSWANQTRILSLQTDSLKASLGQGFIYAFTPAINCLNLLMEKLVGAAECFKNFMAVITGNSEETESFANVATGAEESVEEVDSLTSSLEEAKREMAGFDKITKLSGDSEDSEDSDSGLGSYVSLTGTTQVDMDTDMEDVLDNLTTALTHLKEALNPLKKTLFSGLKWGYDKVLKPLAKWTIENIIPVFFETLAAALELLNGTLEFLMPMWIWTWDHFFEPLAGWTGGIVAGVLWDIADCFRAIGKNDYAAAAVAGLTSALVVYKAGGWAGTALEFLDAKLKSLSTLGKITLAVGIALTGFEIGKSIYQMITGDTEEYRLADLFDSDWEDIKAGLAMTVDDFKFGMSIIFDSVGECADGIGKYFSDCAKKIYNYFIKPVIENVKNAVDNIDRHFSDCAKEIYNCFIAPVIKNVKNAWNGITTVFSNVGPWFSNQFLNAAAGIRNAWSGVTGFFGNVWTGIKGAFGNVAGWFQTTFQTAWQAVKNVFSTGGKIFTGIVNGITNSFKNVVNAIIGGINKVIAIPFDKINGMLNDIRSISILGVEPFKGLWDKNPLAVPEIPMLAQGGYVKPNTPQLAMIGDNRHQGEVVAPEDKLTEMAIAAAKAAGGGGISKAELEAVVNNAVLRIVSALGRMGFYIGSEEIAKAVMAGMESLDSRYNPVKII